jgi:membrane fusion protein, multidrug efflux system
MSRSVAFVVISLLGALPLAACKKPEPPAAKAAEKASPPVEVQTGKVERRKMPNVVTLLGNVGPDRQSEVAANVVGRVVLAPIERGQTVKAGETLALVDSKAANLSASAATSQAELAETQSRQAHSDCERSDQLLAQGAIGQAEFDRQRSQCKAQEFQANAARAQAELSAKLASDAVIRAPFTGVIGERYVNAGEYVQANTKIASMYSTDPVRITISVPERGVSLVRSGVTLNIQVSAYPDRLFPATVQYVSPALRTVQRDLLVEAKAPNSDGALRPGMFATVQASLGDEQVSTVPDDAIRVEGDVRRLFLAQDDRAFELVVRTGISRDGRTVIYEDLAEGTAVIRQPTPGLRDGDPIHLGATASNADLQHAPDTGSVQHSL